MCSINPSHFWTKEQEEYKIHIRSKCSHVIPHEPTYQLSPIEVKEMDAHLKESLDLGFIHPSKSPFACPTFLANKRAE